VLLDASAEMPLEFADIEDETSVGHNRYISIIELIEIIALYNRMIIRIVRL
jgi:hypothetical protein